MRPQLAPRTRSFEPKKNPHPFLGVKTGWYGTGRSGLTNPQVFLFNAFFLVFLTFLQIFPQIFFVYCWDPPKCPPG